MVCKETREMGRSVHHINVRPSKEIFARIITLAVVIIGIVSLSSRIATAEAVLGTPEITSPVNGGFSNSSSVALNWNPVEHATAYTVQLVRSPVCNSEIMNDSSAVVHTATVAEPTYTVAVGDAGYCWRVQAVQTIAAAELKGDWSTLAQFKVDTVAPILAVAPWTQDAPNLTGTVDSAEVTLKAIVDGQERSEQMSVALTPNDEGLYGWSLPLGQFESGDYSIVIRAIDTAGNQTVSDPYILVIPESIIKVSPAITSAAILPLIATSPLAIAVSPPTAPVSSDEMMTPAYTEVAQTTPVAASPAVFGAQAAALEPGHAPVQASSEGWLLFGIPWYAMLIVIGIAAAVWWLVSRVRLRQRLARGLNVSNPVY